MNYLAHFALTAEHPAWITGALLGDFIKGPLVPGKHRPGVTEGIVLHWRIDSFSSAHPAYQDGVSVLAPRWRRYSGIALDVVFDRFLTPLIALPRRRHRSAHRPGLPNTYRPVTLHKVLAELPQLLLAELERRFSRCLSSGATIRCR